MGALYLWMQVASGVILILAGLQLLRGNSNYDSSQTGKNMQTLHPAWIILSIGIVPCPLAAVMFIYCITANMVVKGLLLVAAFALGMGLTLLVIATLIWLIKSKADHPNRQIKTRRSVSLINLVSGLLFILLGLLIMLPTIQKLL